MYDENGNLLNVQNMSLRDWFAGQALAGWLSDHRNEGSLRTMVNSCYNYADAMLEARMSKRAVDKD